MCYEIAVFGLVTIINTINRVTEKQESIALSMADIAGNTCALGCKPQKFDRGYQTSVSNEVIEHLFKEFSLSGLVKYVVTQNSDDTRDPGCSNDEEQRHTPYFQ